MKKRSSSIVLVLTVLSCGQFAALWADEDASSGMVAEHQRHNVPAGDVTVRAVFTDIWVDQAEGHNVSSTTGAQADPFKSITYAMLTMTGRGAPDPWRLRIKAGVYDYDPAKPANEREVFPIELRDGMTLEGADGADVCIVSGAFNPLSNVGLVRGQNVASVTVRDLTFRDMNRTGGTVRGAGLELMEVSGTLERCTLTSNDANMGGGAWVSLLDGGTLYLLDNTFTDNGGGGLYVQDAFTGNVSGNTFSGNEFCGFTVVGAFTGDVSGNIFVRNTFSLGGGGFSVGGAFTGNVSGNTFTRNSGGGGFNVGGTFAGNISSNTFVGNSWGGNGGAFHVWGELAGDISNNTFAGNHGVCYGAFSLGSLNGAVASNTFSRNSTDNDGCDFGLLWASATSQALIVNNMFLYGASLNPDTLRGAALELKQSATVLNNTFWAGEGSTVPCVKVMNSANMSILENNIFANTSVGIWEEGELHLPITHNDFYGQTNIVYRNGIGLGNDFAFLEMLLPDFRDNHDEAPGLVGEDLAEGVWTTSAVYDAVTNRTTLTDTEAAWTPGMWKGAFLDISNQPGKKGHFLILDNTANQISVQGNLADTGVVELADAYSIDDYRLAAGSANIDAGVQGALADFEGEPRPFGSANDIGADEYTPPGTPGLSVTPTSRDVGAAGGTAVFNIVTTAAWTATSSQTWAAVANPSGTGNATLTLNCQANTGTVRSASIVVTGAGTSPAVVQVTVNQAAFTPTLLVMPSNQNVGPTAGSTTFSIETTAAWTANSNQTWATIANPSGTGNATLTVNYQENSGPARSAMVTVTGSGTSPSSVQVTVDQTAATPKLSVTPSSQNVGATGGSATFSIQTTAAWTASSNQTWATIANPSGTGNATLTVNCEENAGAARSVTVTVTGSDTNPDSIQVTVTQAAPVTPVLSATPSSQNVGAAAGSATFSIQTTAAWTASSNQTWATMANQSGTGDATLTVNYQANTGASRSAAITVTGTGTSPGSVQVTVNQAAGTRRTLTVTVSPANAGTVTKNPLPDAADGKYADGTQVTLTANPNNGYTFGSWTGDASGTNPSVQVTMSADRAVTANFTPEPGDWESTEFVRTVIYYDCWDRTGYVKVSGATEVRLVLSAYNIETNADTLSTSAGDNITGQSATPLTTSAATGDTISLTLKSNDLNSGYITFARVEYRGVESGAAFEVGGDLFNGSQEDDCPPCCGSSGGKANGIEGLKKAFGDFLVLLFGAGALIAVSSRKPFGL